MGKRHTMTAGGTASQYGVNMNGNQGGGTKKQGLPPTIGRAGWFSNFIRIHSGGYFRSIPDAAQNVASCIIGAIWAAAGGGVTDKTWVDITSDATGQYVWAIANDNNIEVANILLRSTDFGVTFTSFTFTLPSNINGSNAQSIAIAPNNPSIVYFGNTSANVQSLFKCNVGTGPSPNFSDSDNIGIDMQGGFNSGITAIAVGNNGNQLIVAGQDPGSENARDAIIRQSNNGGGSQIAELPAEGSTLLNATKIQDISVGGGAGNNEEEHRYILAVRTAANGDGEKRALLSTTGSIANMGFVNMSPTLVAGVACAVSRTTGQYMYIADNEHEGHPSRIWRSENSGENWSADSAHQPPFEDPVNEVFSHKGLSCSADGKNVVVSTWHLDGGGQIGYIYVSADFGKTWTKRQGGSWQSLTSNSDGKKIVAGRNQGKIFYSNCD